MTTIAVKNGILAADTQINIDSVKLFGHKLVRVAGSIYAIAGNADIELAFLDWAVEKIKPFPRKCIKNFEAIEVDSNANISYYCATPGSLPLDAPFYAIGSGWKIAMAGMACGLSASDAVKLAGSLDIYTNQFVDTYNIRTKRFTLQKIPK